MPCDRAASSKIVTTLSKAVAKAVGKPEQYVMVSLRADTPMCFGGTEEPCAYGELVSIGAIGGDKNKKVRGVRPAERCTLGVQRRAAADPAACRPCCLAPLTPPSPPPVQISAAVAAVVEEHCGVPPARFYLKFYDVGASDFGWNGSTF